MKTKFFLLAGIFSLAALNTFATTFSRTTSNGGEHGYDFTSKTVDSDGNTTIFCSNPGYEACPLTITGTNQGDGTLANYASTQIQAGVLSGSHTSGNKTVTWTSNNTSMTTSSIQVQ